MTLRSRLQEMTEVEDISQHPSLLEALSLECPNSIRLLDSPHPIDRYTCLMHVFDLTEKPEYIHCAMRNVYAGADFAHWLLNRFALGEKPLSEADDGDLVFYFNGGQFKHVGILRGAGRVLSKWGSGHLYEHDLFEVPDSYGNEVRAFAHMAPEDAYYVFTLYAEEKGVEFEDADP